MGLRRYRRLPAGHQRAPRGRVDAIKKVGPRREAAVIGGDALRALPSRALLVGASRLVSAHRAHWVARLQWRRKPRHGWAAPRHVLPAAVRIWLAVCHGEGQRARWYRQLSDSTHLVDALDGAGRHPTHACRWDPRRHLQPLGLACSLLHTSCATAAPAARVRGARPTTQRRRLAGRRRRGAGQWSDATTGAYRELDLGHFLEVWSAGPQSREEVHAKLHALCYEYVFRPPVGEVQRKALLHLLRLPPMHDDDPSTGSVLLGLKLNIDRGSSRFAKIVSEPPGDGTSLTTAAPALWGATQAERDAGARVATLRFADGLADEMVVVEQIARIAWRVSASLEIRVEAVRCETSLWIMQQTAAAFRSTQIMAEMQRYKEEARQSEGGRTVIDELLAKFGSVEQALCEPANHLADIVGDNPHKNELHETLDADALVPLAVWNGRAAHGFFRKKLQSLFPSAQIFKAVDEATESIDRFAWLIAPVKGSARIKVKAEEYRSEFDNDPAQYPFVTKVSTMSRCSLPPQSCCD